jgi:dienelactone hydrolase
MTWLWWCALTLALGEAASFARPSCLGGELTGRRLVSTATACRARPYPLRMTGGGGGAAGVIEFKALLPGLVTASNEAAAAMIQDEWKRDADIAAAKGAEVRRELVEYSDGDTRLRGIAVWREDPAQRIEQIPGVLVLGTAVGLEEDLIFWKLEALAAQGFLAFGADLFGSGHALWDRSENVPVRAALTDDRRVLARRTQAGLAAMGAHAQCDETRMGAMGFCFGGMAAMDLARTCRDPGLRTAIAFHGILDRPALPDGPVLCSVLACHGDADPFVPPEKLAAFEQDMAARGATCSVLRPLCTPFWPRARALPGNTPWRWRDVGPQWPWEQLTLRGRGARGR